MSGQITLFVHVGRFGLQCTVVIHRHRLKTTITHHSSYNTGKKKYNIINTVKIKLN